MAPITQHRGIHGAYRKGWDAAMSGQLQAAYPYRDYRTSGSRITFGRAFRRAWVEGYRDAQAVLEHSTKTEQWVAAASGGGVGLSDGVSEGAKIMTMTLDKILVALVRVEGAQATLRAASEALLAEYPPTRLRWS